MTITQALRVATIRADRRASGFGMVEILVSLILLGILSTTLIPIFITSIKLAQLNAVVTRGTQVVNQQLDLARAQARTTPTCNAIKALKVNSTALSNPNAPEAEPLHYATTIGACPTSYPGTVMVTVTVTRDDTGNSVVTDGSTLVIVTSEGS